jgi:phage terminase large subunit GpA-like protein
MLISTPTIKDLSRIEAAYNESDKRRFFVPCPECGIFQYLKWANVIWEKEQTEGGKEIHKSNTAVYKCENCGDEWSDAKRWAAVREGKWISTAKASNETVIGFHINEISSPWVRLRDMVQNFLEAKDNPERLKAFINTSLGEPWEEKGQTVDEHKLYGRREKYPAEVPAGGLVLVCGVDVQDDRLEGEVIAYGEGRESWGIEYFKIYGDPAAPGIWQQLDGQLQRIYKHESGIELRIVCTCIDSGGHFTDQVYLFCKGKAYRRIFAVKGSNTIGRPIIAKATKNNKYKVNLFSVGTDTTKELIYRQLLMETTGAGYMHFPIKYDNEYFEQLTAEKAVTKFTRGFPIRQWIKIRPRNEVLDIRVYGLAALIILNPNFRKIKESFEGAEDRPKPKEEIDDRPVEQNKGLRTKVKRPIKKNWVSNWGG